MDYNKDSMIKFLIWLRVRWEVHLVMICKIFQLIILGQTTSNALTICYINVILCF